MKDTLNPYGQRLKQLLQTAEKNYHQHVEYDARAQKIHVAGAGGVLTAAYEQLRNAAENAEEHVLLQRAIKRFFRRIFLVRDERQIHESGEELTIELTLAGYLANDSINTTTIKKINMLARQYYSAYEVLQRRHFDHKNIERWTIDVLAVRVEWLLHDPVATSAYVQFVQEYYLSADRLTHIVRRNDPNLEPALYVAIQRALMKADLARVRAGLLSRYQQTPEQLEAYIAVNRQIDKLFESSTVEKLYRYIDRRGAPLRVLKHLIDDDDLVAHNISNKTEFLRIYEAQVQSDYQSINQKINRGIIKSIVFLVITKVLIGVALELPYDYIIFSTIIWLPLLINLFFPPVYMVLLRATLLLPRPANTERLVQQIEQMLYGDETLQLERRRASQSFGVGFNIAYGLAFVIVFGGIAYLLWAYLHFELLHLFIFFLFLSGASFLGFRLSRMIREIEAIDGDQNAVTTVRDFLYMPFVVVGRYMSEKYAQLNIVALTLDMVIELPLKTVLRLVRQWAAFINSKKDAL